ncbi:hypothetical protein BDP27DRAFT_671779 [Rhodocollybia butyracea]|uniref:Uncharacterized protein n=1 Tax=Rhodocollybia butyracea TaxID=206335 RepID=A0A9P5PUS6_9AGAR|nr:hypothetical protein BDP27DRAFT_671779 [Rhodocollybia butyracea]
MLASSQLHSLASVLAIPSHSVHFPNPTTTFVGNMFFQKLPHPLTLPNLPPPILSTWVQHVHSAFDSTIKYKLQGYFRKCLSPSTMPSAIETCLEPESNDWGAVSPSNASGLIEIDASPLEKIQLGFHESCGSIIIYQRNKPHSVAVHSSRSTQCASLALDVCGLYMW